MCTCELATVCVCVCVCARVRLVLALDVWVHDVCVRALSRRPESMADRTRVNQGCGYVHEHAYKCKHACMLVWQYPALTCAGCTCKCAGRMHGPSCVRSSAAARAPVPSGPARRGAALWPAMLGPPCDACAACLRGSWTKTRACRALCRQHRRISGSGPVRSPARRRSTGRSLAGRGEAVAPSAARRRRRPARRPLGATAARSRAAHPPRCTRCRCRRGR